MSGIKSSSRPSNGRANSEGEDDLVEIRDTSRLASVKSKMNREPAMRTPPTSSREQSTSSAPPPPHHSNKRSAGQVVDLTNSSDEDEDPVRAPKRQNTQTLSNDLSGIPNTEAVPIRANNMHSGYQKLPQFPSSPFPTPAFGSRGYGQPPRP